jgi:hypothetical protein
MWPFSKAKTSQLKRRADEEEAKEVQRRKLENARHAKKGIFFMN